MSDTKISALPAVAATADADRLPIVQGSGAGAVTRNATVAQLRGGILADRPYHVRDFGAVGDGTTNDAPAIQAAIDAMNAAGGGTLEFGARSYRIASPVVVDSVSITFQGAGFTEGPSIADGTWLRIDTTGFTPFTFTGTGARGSTVRDIAVRQTHNATQDATWAPTNYDFVFRVQDCLGSVTFKNVLLVAVNRGIWCDNSGRLNIESLRGQVFTTGIEIDRAFDACRIEHIHFWPFATSDDDVVRWQQQNCDAVVLRKVDGIFIDDAFALGARSMLRLASSASGVPTKVYVGSLYADFVLTPIWVEGNGVTAQMASITTQSELFNSGGQPLVGGNGIRIDGNNARLQIANLRIDDAESNSIRVNGSGNRVDVFSFRAEYYNRLNDGSAAIHVANVASGTPNAVHLGSPALLGNGNAGPLVNTGTNGHVALGAPAGRIDRPGVMLGFDNQGFFSPSSTEIAASAAGVEVLRASSAGTISLGGASGAHGLGITTPTNSVNRVAITSAVTAGTPSIMAQGTDANIALAIAAKGTSTIRLQTRGQTAFEVNATGTPGNYIRADAAASGGWPRIIAQGSDTNVHLQLAVKGTAYVESTAPFKLPTYTVATLPSAATFARCLIFVSDGTANKRFAVSDGTSWRWPDGAVVS
ncbi:glycosyl hydrolase family 28-related protein [Roseomonas sp. CAU 1739]|uniref:glycosyl hydrolase family 28-related protein n=1 Tax=Roseomonas sp. CAU 1739 TaxID=3140364 RepID=UPI00325BC49C